jgi:hypothetical protein
MAWVGGCTGVVVLDIFFGFVRTSSCCAAHHGPRLFLFFLLGQVFGFNWRFGIKFPKINWVTNENT